MLDLLAIHWSTGQSDFERAPLTALDAYVDLIESPGGGWERDRSDIATMGDTERRLAHGPRRLCRSPTRWDR